MQWGFNFWRYYLEKEIQQTEGMWKVLYHSCVKPMVFWDECAITSVGSKILWNQTHFWTEAANVTGFITFVTDTKVQLLLTFGGWV